MNDNWSDYLTRDGVEVPDEVAEHFRSPEEWAFLDPTRIPAEECLLCGDEIFIGETEESCWFCGSTEYCGATKWGQTHVEHIHSDGPYFALHGDGGVMCGGCYESFEEYGDTLVIVDADANRYKLVYDGNVGFDYGEFASDFEYLNGPALELAKQISAGTERIRVDGWRSYTDVRGDIEANGIEFTEVGGGWHSTMDRSDFSDRINELTRGEYHIYEKIDYPIAVRYGKTSNLFSMIINVFAPVEHATHLADTLGRAKHSGIAGGISYSA